MGMEKMLPGTDEIHTMNVCEISTHMKGIDS